MKKFSNILLLTLLLSLTTKAQTCGFGCLGMSGFYGGYTVQEYDAVGLNDIVSKEIPNESFKTKFGRAKGYRVGANIFRANFSGFFVTAKGFYQFLDEAHQYKLSSDTKDYKLKLNYWGLGLDLGFSVFSLLDLKLIEGGATIYTTKFEISQGNNSVVKKYEDIKTDLSYYVGTGLIFHLVPNYLSLEGTAFYSIFQIDKLEDAKGQSLNEVGSNPIIAGKKFGVTVQLNLGLPL